MPDLWTWLWIAWAAAFAIIEGVALTRDKHDGTLSHHLRHWFRVDTHLGRTAWLVVSGVFLAWFITHIAH
jgi:hypothetical protein